jgi:hypothetical protein
LQQLAKSLELVCHQRGKDLKAVSHPHAKDLEVFCQMLPMVQNTDT